jgi:hypothetical protein
VGVGVVRRLHLLELLVEPPQFGRPYFVRAVRQRTTNQTQSEREEKREEREDEKKQKKAKIYFFSFFFVSLSARRRWTRGSAANCG